MTTGRRTFNVTVFLLWGTLLAWATYFLLLYVVIALACERGYADAQIAGFRLIPAAGVVGFVLALGVTGALAAAAWRRWHGATSANGRFLGFVAMALGLLALAALAWTTLPPVLLDTGCA